MSDASASEPGLRSLFITGMQRSGTTLLDKLLCNHPALSVLSQPLPSLLLETKQAFLRQRGCPRSRYPMGNLLLEDRYSAPELRRFADRFIWKAPEVKRLLGRSVRGLGDGPLAVQLGSLYRLLAHRPEAKLFGGKEILCEEFLPHLLGSGFHGVIVLRDPRDVITSLNFGGGRKYGGLLKPTLFNLRNWRKSVAFGLRLGSEGRCLVCRYEDLVRETFSELDRVCAALGVEPFAADAFRDGIRDQRGELWGGNSSHDRKSGVSGSSVGRHRQLLPSQVARYVEATCYPELAALGYPATLRPGEAQEIIEGFRDPFPVERQDLAIYADPAVSAAQELERLARLAESPGPESRRWFLFRRVHETLRRAVAAL